MSIYKQKNSRYWWTAIYVPGSGSRYIRTSTNTEDKIKAAAIEQSIKLALHRAAPAEQLHALIDALLGSQRKAGIPIGAVWDAYSRIWDIGGKEVEEKTLRGRQRIIERLESWIKENRPAVVSAGDVDRGTASDYAEALKRSGAKSKTRKNVITEISVVWRELADAHGITNPWPGVVPEVTDSKRGIAFTRDEEAAVIKAADLAGYDWGVICRIARHTGLRYGDVASLTGADVDRDNLAIRLRPSKTSRHGIAVILPVPADVASMLPMIDGPLFVEASNSLPGQLWRCPFSRVLEAAGLADGGFTFHSWRHTFRTRLSEAGVSDDMAKRLGGWKIDKTANIYDHAERIGELRAAVESASR